MKNTPAKKRIIAAILLFAFTFCLFSCTAHDEPSDSSDLNSKPGKLPDPSSDSTSTDNDESDDSDPSYEDYSDFPSSDTSDESKEEPSSEEPSSDESKEEPSSEESSEAPSEDPSSKDDSSEDDTSAMNPYDGTDIKPAEGKVIAFTFDDGPSYTSSTTKILDKLEELNMPATFFVVGNRVSASTAPMIKRMVELGCDIGNHSFDHPNFNTLSDASVKAQIDNTNKRLEKYVGVKATLIRPPYGNIKTTQMSKLNTPIICWDIDSLDWELRDAQKIYERTMARVHSGGIILMHDIYDTTAEAFCMIADELVKQGYTLVTISELLGTEKLMCTTVKYGFQW